MDAAFWFNIANPAAIVGWLLMAVAPRWSVTRWTVHRGLLPMALSVLYLVLVVTSWGNTQGSFQSLAGVKQLFANDWVLLTGWVHYLVFDMVVGSWALRDSWTRQIPHAVMVPVLFFTLMLGPVGFLGYMGLTLFWKQVNEESPEAS